MSQRLNLIVEQILTGFEFKNDAVEKLVESAFVAGAKAMDALYTLETSEPTTELDTYVSGIAGLTQQIGAFLSVLTPAQVQAYRDSLKKVIVNEDEDVELALEAFADANLDLTAALLQVNAAIDALTPPTEEVPA